ncbi:hypothetical protein EDD35_4725 [Amycolatopsis thermoflava]|uniref:Uncharacterized protein n=1 Tax=Amycolatopsis thermoflava TaxID=84480 RepID=A0A3N2H096_9PSEU|nr:hypothetical protein EDD35_4725 [Amycolatopsis thermoflava]
MQGLGAGCGGEGGAAVRVVNGVAVGPVSPGMIAALSTGVRGAAVDAGPAVGAVWVVSGWPRVPVGPV